MNIGTITSTIPASPPTTYLHAQDFSGIQTTGDSGGGGGTGHRRAMPVTRAMRGSSTWARVRYWPFLRQLLNLFCLCAPRSRSCGFGSFRSAINGHGAEDEE